MKNLCKLFDLPSFWRLMSLISLLIAGYFIYSQNIYGEVAAFCGAIMFQITSNNIKNKNE